MATHFQFTAILQTISSKDFEKLVITGRKTSPNWFANLNDRVLHSSTIDRVFYSFAERLRKLGATKPLTMVLEYNPTEEGVGDTLDVQHIWPLFCEVSVIVKDYNSGRRWGLDTCGPRQRGGVAVSIYLGTQCLTTHL